jgi:uncharacterized membrane protein YgcG
MTTRRALTWVAVAALGVGLTTALTITTTLLAQQPIGLSSEPPSAGNALVPRVASAPAAVIRHRAKPKPKSKPKPPATSPHRASRHVPPVVPAAPIPAPAPAVPIPTATVPAPTTSTVTRPANGPDGGGGGSGRQSGKNGNSHDGGGGGGGTSHGGGSSGGGDD